MLRKSQHNNRLFSQLVSEFYYSPKERAKKAEIISDQLLRILIKSISAIKNVSSADDLYMKEIYLDFLKNNYGVTEPTIENLQKVKEDFYKFMNADTKVEDFLFVASLQKKDKHQKPLNPQLTQRLSELEKIQLDVSDYKMLFDQFKLDCKMKKQSINSNTKRG